MLQWVLSKKAMRRSASGTTKRDKVLTHHTSHILMALACGNILLPPVYEVYTVVSSLTLSCTSLQAMAYSLNWLLGAPAKPKNMKACVTAQTHIDLKTGPGQEQSQRATAMALRLLNSLIKYASHGRL